MSGRRETSTRPSILVLVDFYPPAFRAGGPTRSVPRIAAQLRDEFRFLVLTRDRDLGSSSPLPDVASDRWMYVRGAGCLYLSARRRLLGGLLRAIRRTPHDVLYVNSLFSMEYSAIPLLLRRLRILPRRGLVVAPRGELDDHALSIKSRRKALYLAVIRRTGLLRGAVWHAATAEEAAAITERIGARARIVVAVDIPVAAEEAGAPGPPPKRPGAIEVAFMGRIAPIKNLDFAISTLAGVRGTVHLNVYGPIEDAGYWEACQRLARTLPDNVTLEYRGVVQPDDSVGTLARHHLLFLPTRTESYGHVIVEALIAGCPVLISDQTPWRGLEGREAGWDLPLSRPDLFTDVIQTCVGMDEPELGRWAAGARRYGRAIAEDPERDGAYREMFRAARERRSPGRAREALARDRDRA